MACTASGASPSIRRTRLSRAAVMAAGLSEPRSMLRARASTPSARISSSLPLDRAATTTRPASSLSSVMSGTKCESANQSSVTITRIFRHGRAPMGDMVENSPSLSSAIRLDGWQASRRPRRADSAARRSARPRPGSGLQGGRAAQTAALAWAVWARRCGGRRGRRTWPPLSATSSPRRWQRWLRAACPTGLGGVLGGRRSMPAHSDNGSWAEIVRSLVVTFASPHDLIFAK